MLPTIEEGATPDPRKQHNRANRIAKESSTEESSGGSSDEEADKRPSKPAASPTGDVAGCSASCETEADEHSAVRAGNDDFGERHSLCAAVPVMEDCSHKLAGSSNGGRRDGRLHWLRLQLQCRGGAKSWKVCVAVAMLLLVLLAVALARWWALRSAAAP